MNQIATSADFTLYDQPWLASGDWRSLKLVRNSNQPKPAIWWLGWNGQRLSRNHAEARLREREPELHSWVIASLQHAGKPVRTDTPASGIFS